MLRYDSRLLRAALLGNAMFSGACGLSLFLAPVPVGAWLGVFEPPLLMSMGAGLLMFAGALALLATRRRLSPTWVRVVVAADASWVVGSFLFLLSPLAGALSRPGTWTVAGVALVVAFWGALQTLGALVNDGRPAEALP